MVSLGEKAKLKKVGNLNKGPSYVTTTVTWILVHSHFDLVSSLLTLEANEVITKIALEMINIHLISVMLKRLV